MEISAEKTRLTTNSANSILREIKVKGQNLGTVQASGTSEQMFQMMAPKPEVLSRIAKATAAFTKLKPVWSDKNIPGLPCHSCISVCL